MKTCTICRLILDEARFPTLRRNGKPTIQTAHCKECEKARIRSWRKKNPHKVSEQQKRRTDSGRAKQSTRRWRQAYPDKYRLLQYKSRAKRKGYTITEEVCEKLLELFHQPCCYCGSAPSPLNGVDRIDSSIGYEINNIVSCCEECNLAKLDRPLDQFFEWIRRVHNGEFHGKYRNQKT